MTMHPATTRKQIQVNIWKPLLGKLVDSVRSACLQRDAYLDRVLSHEASSLREEMGDRNSDEAYAYLSAQLKSLKPIKVNLKLSEETVALICAVCTEKNVPRDSFVNRIFLFLAFTAKNFDRLGYLPLPMHDLWTDVVQKNENVQDFLPLRYLFDGSLTAIDHVISEDPFFGVRQCIAVVDGEPLHKWVIMQGHLSKLGARSSIGFNCYLPDHMIEVHPACELLEAEWELI